MRRSNRLALQGQRHHSFDLIITNATRCARSWFVDQTVQTLLHEALAPFPNRHLMNTQFCGDLLIREPTVGRKNNACPKSQRLRSGRSTRPLSQTSTFGIGDGKGRKNATGHG